ncbi:MAG: hypothetical protein MJ202_09100 [Lentisphaeria bacterium]|nr:hypothetical protein [Lentisphaeria bacterium]
MIQAGFQLAIWARTDIACFVGVMASPMVARQGTIKMPLTQVFTTPTFSHGAAVSSFLGKQISELGMLFFSQI